MASHRGGGSNRRRHQMCPGTCALPALEVPVRRGRTALPCTHHIGVHPQTHRTPGITPLHTGPREDHVQPLGFSLPLHRHGPGDHERANVWGHPADPQHLRRARRSSIRLFVQEPMNTVSIATSRIGVPAAKPMYDSALAAASRISPAGHSSGSGTAPSRGTPWPGLVPRVDAVDEDGWRTNKPTLLRLLLTGNHGRTDRQRRQADPIESQAQHRQGDRRRSQGRCRHSFLDTP